MDITRVSEFAKGSYSKLPETGTPLPISPDQNPSPMVITDVSQFQASVQQELQRIEQNWSQLLPTQLGYRGTLIFNLSASDASGNRSIVSIRLILAERISSPHDGEIGIHEFESFSSFSQRPVRQMLTRELSMLSHPEQFVFHGIDSNRIAVHFAVGPRSIVICN